VAAFDSGDFLGAAVDFEVAYRLTGSGEVAFNVGLSYDNAGQPSRAAQWYRVYLEAHPDAPDRPAIEERIAELEGGAAAPLGSAAEDEEQDDHPRANHRLRVWGGWGFYPGGASRASATTTSTPVNVDGFRLELGYQYRLYQGLILDVLLGGTWTSDAQTLPRNWDIWSGAAGLGWVWTGVPYVVLGVRGGIAFYAMEPQTGDIHWLVPFRAGAWVEFPVLDWLALHLGGDLALGAYVGRNDDKVFGFGGEVGAGLCFSLGGDHSEDEDERDDEPETPRQGRPGLHGPGGEIGRDWQ
jgi:hypothetical protein